MIKNSSYYKSNDFLNNNYRNQLDSYFNPFEYNFESNLKDKENLKVPNKQVIDLFFLCLQMKFSWL